MTQQDKCVQTLSVAVALVVCLVTSVIADEAKSIYFGQPLAAYNSKTVQEVTVAIQKQFPGWHIENPNQPKHEEGYQRCKKATGNGMDYYFQELLPTMQGGIFLPFPDGSWSAGAYGEALRLEGLGRPIWKVTPDGTITPTTTEKMRLWDGGILSVAQTREKNKLNYDDEVAKIKK